VPLEELPFPFLCEAFSVKCSWCTPVGGWGGARQVWSWRYSFSKRNGTAMHTKWSHVLPRETGLTLMVSRTGPELFNEIAEVAEVRPRPKAPCWG
jgi:hypothetical protein